MIIAIGSSNSCLFAQNNSARPSRQSSFEAFSKGNYEQAYKEFRELLLTYSKDPLYKYYSGVCLVKLNRDPAEAESLLTQALQSAAVIKTLPSDALFFLAGHNRWAESSLKLSVSYNRCTEQIGKKAARELSIPDFIQQCNEKKGKIADQVIKPAEVIKTEIPVQVAASLPPAQTATKPVEKDAAVKKNLSPETMTGCLMRLLNFR